MRKHSIIMYQLFSLFYFHYSFIIFIILNFTQLIHAYFIQIQQVQIAKKGKNALFPYLYKKYKDCYIFNHNFLKIYCFKILNIVFSWATHCSDIHFFTYK